MDEPSCPLPGSALDRRKVVDGQAMRVLAPGGGTYRASVIHRSCQPMRQPGVPTTTQTVDHTWITRLSTIDMIKALT
jgi:hypothetical protein